MTNPAPRPAIVILFACLASNHVPAAFSGVAALQEAQGQASSSTRDESRSSEINALIDAGDLARARVLLADEVATRGETHPTLFLEAKILFREQKYRESLKILERALALNQRDPETFKLVASNAILINRTDIAEQALKSAAALAPNDYMVFFHLGALYYTDSRFPPAKPMLEKSVELKPDYVPARLFLGLTLEELGQEEASVECYLQAIKLAERSGFKGEQPYLYLGRLLYRQNKLDESLPYLEKAAKANPQSCETLCLLARIHSARDHEADAVAALNQCIQADRNYSEAHYLLSRAYVKQGRKEDAAKELSQFQELKKVEKNVKDPRKNQRVTP
ncbi:MAG: tetratricopeptide repeat protein [Terriglobia bacterium]